MWFPKALLSAFGPICGRANISALWGQKGHFETCEKVQDLKKKYNMALKSACDEHKYLTNELSPLHGF